MKVLEKLNDPELGRQMIVKIKEKAERAVHHLGRPVKLMEVCGTHTTAISRYGLRSLFSELIELKSGPGCPVCVTSAADLEQMIALSRLPGLTIATFGDMLRIPGAQTTLEEERSHGADIKIVYSPADAIELAQKEPEKEIVFLGIGFETTAPLVALSIQQARDLNLNNFSIYPANKLIPPAIKTLLNQENIRVDGFILPGHVSTITGSKAFEFIENNYGIPSAVSGFTAIDILDSIYLLLEKFISGDKKLTNVYRRAVKDEGNIHAQNMMYTYFYPGPASWRGIGNIPGSGLILREQFASYDAARKFSINIQNIEEPKGCRCGELLKGLITPVECPLFRQNCTPANPVGPCMVSPEGACAAYYNYDS